MNMGGVLESVIKPMLLSVGFISTITLLKVAIFPILTNLVITTLPRFWFSLSFLLSPPFVFITFNFIIIAIAASSSSIFRHPPHTSNSHQHQDEDTTAPSDHINSATSKIILLEQEQEEQEQEQGKLVQWDLSTLSTGNVADHPGNFCAYSSGEKVEEEVADGDSMEDTWKAIMEKRGKEKPKLKKSETWDSPRRLIRADGDGDGDDTVARVVKKSNLFKETMSFKRKKSMGHEELKRRAEAFIEMVNTSMRLQRQESEQRFLQLQLQMHKRSV